MWSKSHPHVQVLWDSTSLRALMQCPRRYQYSIVEGWRQRHADPHLTAGSLLQEGIERFQLARLRGEGVDEAGVEAVEFLLQASGEFHLTAAGRDETGRDRTGLDYTWVAWGGDWCRKWRCLGEKNEKGKKKCQHSHLTSAGPRWFLVDDESGPVRSGPARQGKVGSGEVGCCPMCGSNTETTWAYQPHHPTKNRLTLMRAMLAFVDSQHDTKGLQVWALPDGTPAVEVQFRVPLGTKTDDGEDYILVANMDEVNTWQGHLWPSDNKSTSRPLNDAFFEQYSPDVQFDTYDLVASLAPLPLPVGGVAIRGVRMEADTASVDVEYVTKTEGQREEHWRSLQWWAKQAEAMARAGYWPQAKVGCGRCPFRKVCDTDPSMRRAHLEQGFERRPWNPVTRNVNQKGEPT